MSAGSLFAAGGSTDGRGLPSTPSCLSFPSDLDGASPLSHNAFDGLFDGSYSPQSDLHLFEDGPAPADLQGGQGDEAPFPFGNLVDLDADDAADEFGNLGPLDITADFPDQLAATTLDMQPSLGAPSTGRDEQGIAADV